MTTEKLTPAQQVFINEMINGASQKQAYMAAYPGSSAEAAYSSASRLMDKPHIRGLVDDGLEELSWMKQQLLLQHKAERIMAITMQREALARIIYGDWEKTQTITTGGKTTKQKSACDPNICMNAVRLDMKLTQEYDKLIAGMNNKNILRALMKATGITQNARWQSRHEAEENEAVENMPDPLANVSMAEAKNNNPCGNACEKTLESCGNALKETLEDCGNTCGNSYDPPAADNPPAADKKILENCGMTDADDSVEKAEAEIAAALDAISMYDEELERLNKLYELATAEETGKPQHLNRRQRRELERSNAKKLSNAKNLVKCW